MRQLYLNNVLVDIDNKTAIGIDLQAYDLKEPAKRKVNVSNNFTIPKTLKNLKAIGYIGGAQSTSQSLYNSISCNYYINNIQFITDARASVQGIGDRIEILTVNKTSVFDDLKTVFWEDFIESFLTWSNLPTSGSPYSGTFSSFIDQYIVSGGSDGLVLPYTRGNPDDGAGLMTLTDQTANIAESGGYAGVYFSEILKYIEDTYSINLGSNESFDYNIFDDSVFQKMFIMVRDIAPATTATADQFYWALSKDTTTGRYSYRGFGEVEETRDKSLYDLFTAILNVFQATIILENGVYKIRRFNDLDNVTPVDFSGNISTTPKLKPFIDKFNQVNYIKYETTPEDVRDQIMTTLTCNNVNIEKVKELFKIPLYYPQFTDEGVISELRPLITTSESFKSFKFLTEGNTIPELIQFNLNSTVESNQSANKTDVLSATLFDITSEYTLFNSMLSYPVFYEIKKWMRAIDILNLNFFTPYYIKELNGSFFINKIKGFNPDKSRQATTLELIKINNNTPAPPGDAVELWVDGIGDTWTDGVGTSFSTN